MKAHTIDQLPADHSTQPDHFIFQEGTEPSQLSGPVKLKNLNKIEEGTALGVTAEGQIVALEAGLQKQKELIEGVISEVFGQKVEQFIAIAKEKAAEIAGLELQRHKAMFTKGKWLGDDIGSPSEPLRNVHSKGEFFGLRFQNALGLPEFSAKNIGRVLLNKMDEKIYMDLGYQWKRISSEKIQKDIQVSNPSVSITVDISDCDIDDARSAIWQVCENGNDFSRISAKIKTPDAKTVVIDLPLGSSVGTYRLIGLE